MALAITRLLEVAGLGADEEFLESLASGPGWRLERIVSRGQTTPAGQWYDQDEDEWVTVLSGAARLRIEGGSELAMGPGDAVMLPAHVRHRVTWTDPGRPTVWLALFTSPAHP